MNAPDKAAPKTDAGKSATLDISGKQVTMPMRSGTIGPDVIDIGKVYANTGSFTYDPGFTSTANCSSKITYIDGDKGVLLYRGYPIEQLAEHSSHLEVCYLLLNGELPNQKQFEEFRGIVSRHTMVHEQMTRFLPGLPPRRASDGRDVRLGRRTDAPSITTPPTSTIRASASSPRTA